MKLALKEQFDVSDHQCDMENTYSIFAWVFQWFKATISIVF